MTQESASNRPATTSPHSHGLGGVGFAIGLTIVEIGLSIVLFDVARDQGAGTVAAYLIASAAPIAGAVVYWVRGRSFSGASAAIFSFTVLSALVAVVGGGDATLLLYKDAGATGIVGLIFLGSLGAPRPLAFHFGQRFATGATPEGIAWWNGLWQYPQFRRTQRIVTAVWAVAFLVEAILKSLVIASLDYDTAYTFTQILPFVAVALALVTSIAIVRRTARPSPSTARRAQR